MPLLLIIALLIIGLFPDLTDAQGLVSTCEGASCSACNFVELANNVIKWLVGILFLVFGVLAVIAGAKLVVSGGNPSAKQAAKSSLTNAFIGLFIVLASWILIDTLMRFVLSGNDGSVEGFGPWSEIQCGTQVAPGKGNLNSVDFERDDVVRNTNTFSSSSVNMANLGSGNEAIVEYARRVDTKQCLYSQARRNGCNGNPGYTDCSDLVSNAFQAAGCRSPGNTTATMYPRATSIGQKSTLQAGDAIVYRKGGAGHVVICADAGCSRVIHASGRGAPDNQAAVTPAAEQIKISNSSYYLNQPGAKALRAADYCN